MKKMTWCEQFLADMKLVVAWVGLRALIEWRYPKAGLKGGQPPRPLQAMLRIYSPPCWYALSGSMAEETHYESELIRWFAGSELGAVRIPGETTIQYFRHLLGCHGRTGAIFGVVNAQNAHLATQGITLRFGMHVHATIISAPSSIKHNAMARDPELSSTKKGSDWFFDIESHVGVEVDTDTVRSLEAKTAKVPDCWVWDDPLHGEGKSIWADKGYICADLKATFSTVGKVWGVMRKVPKGGQLDPIDEQINLIIAKVRAKLEDPCRVIKRQFGHVKIRYCATKNPAQLLTLLHLAICFWFDDGCKH